MGEGGGRSAPVAESAGWKADLTADCRRRIVEKMLGAMRKSLPNSGTEVLAGLKQLVMRFEETIYNEATSSVEYLRRISTQLIRMENKSQTCVANCSADRGPNRCSNPASTTMRPQIQIKNERKLPIPYVKQSEFCQNSSLPASMEENAQNSSNNSLNEKGDQPSDLIDALIQQLFGREKHYQDFEQQENNYQEQQEFLTHSRNQKRQQQGKTQSILCSYHPPQQPLLLQRNQLHGSQLPPMLAQQTPTLGQNARISSLNPQQHPPVQNNSSGRQQKQQLTQHLSLPNTQQHRNLIHTISEAKIMEAQHQSNRHASLVAFPFQGQQQSSQLQMQASNALQLKSTTEQQKQHPFQAQEGILEASSTPVCSTVETGLNVPYIQEKLYQKVPLQIPHWENHDNQMNQTQLTVVQSSGLSSTPMPLSTNMAVLHEQQLEFVQSSDQIHGNTVVSSPENAIPSTHQTYVNDFQQGGISTLPQLGLGLLPLSTNNFHSNTSSLQNEQRLNHHHGKCKEHLLQISMRTPQQKEQFEQHCIHPQLSLEKDNAPYCCNNRSLTSSICLRNCYVSIECLSFIG